MMIDNQALKTSQSDLSANTAQSASKTQEPPQVNLNYQAIQHIELIKPSEIAQIAAVDSDLARDIVSEILSEQRKLNAHYANAIQNEQKLDKLDLIFKTFLSSLLIILFFVVVLFLALNDKLTPLSGGITSIAIVASIITALGLAISRIIKAIKS